MQAPQTPDSKNRSGAGSPAKEIFARVWALWGLVTFASTFLIIVIPSMCSYLMPYMKGQVFFIRIGRIWMRVWLFLIGCRLSIQGREYFEPGENYIVAFNHNALLDAPLSAPFLPGANKTIAKKSFAQVPIFGWFYRRGAILVDRNSHKSRIRSYEEMKKVLTSGMHMCLYPEGTRNRTGLPLKPFYDGAFKLAADTGKKIIPCVLVGTREAMPIHKVFYLMPTPLKIFFLPPVSPEHYDVKTLREKTFQVMWDKYEAETSGDRQKPDGA
jgi:1-acyl-sn-glycerol-3-phosphate acyltransferase